MCDYSLEKTAQRPAKVGEELAIGSNHHGFCDPNMPAVAVCLLPGTELYIKGHALLRLSDDDNKPPISLLSPERIDGAAKFFQRSKLPSRRRRPRDAIEMADGGKYLIAGLRIGTTAKVLQLPMAELPADTALQLPAEPARAKEPAELLRAGSALMTRTMMAIANAF
jgi:hypothetical protein